MRERNAWAMAGILLAPIFLLALAVGLTSAFSSQAFAQIFTEPEKPKPTPTDRKPKRKTERPDSARPAPQPPMQQQEAQRIEDPANYCSAIGDLDEPRATSGPPKWLVDGTLASNRIAAGTTGSVSWRCMDRKVYSCFDGGASAHCQQPDASTKPRKAYTDFCRANPNSGIPAAVTGMTVAIWECRKGRPVVARFETSSLDKRGFYRDQWVDVSRYAPGAMIGAVPGPFIGKWRINAGGKGLLNPDYLVGLEITGGSIGAIAGKADYFIGGMRGTQEFACSSNLILTSASATALVLSEQIPNRTLYCPKARVLTVSPLGSQMQFNWSKTGDRKMKVVATGVGQR